jgi:uncharacterized protein DUF5681
MANKTSPGIRRKQEKRKRKKRDVTALIEKGKATRFQPGQSGNPSGRARDVVSKVMREMLPEPCPLDRTGRAWAEAIALAVFKKAVRGDIRAAAEIFDRTEGKARQSVDVSAVGVFATLQGAPVGLDAIDKRLCELLERSGFRRTIEIPKLGP